VDPYQTLGVTKAADSGEIKRAYRKLCLQWHPDKHPNDPSAQDRFKDINAAYHILSDPGRRRDFDRGTPTERARTSSNARQKAERDIANFMNLFSQFLGDLVGDDEGGSGFIQVRDQQPGESELPIDVDDEFVTIRQGGFVIRVKKPRK
jgi:molecular chaperone DnaJ